MDKIKLRTFDIFRYVAPGVLLIYFHTLVYTGENSITEPFTKYYANLNFASAILLVLCSYIIGLTIDQIGRSFVGLMIKIKKIDRLFNGDVKTDKSTTLAEKYAYLREYGQASYQQIQLWNSLKGMCQNISIDFLVLFIISISKICERTNTNYWTTIAILSLIIISLLIHKAIIYERWSIQDVEASIKVIKEHKK